jgi:exopolysaccharide biosynthesis polyprenyl glycosylphosphotransferase
LIDILVSGIGLIILSPIFLVIAILIKITSEGPVFYEWNVMGFNKKPFRSWKFRTMVQEADAQKEALMAINEMKGPVFKIKNDPRITRVGRFLRKYSLDELPQLWSVFKGDMSLVGPRPAFPNELARYESWHRRKLSIKPGITCLWQISGRNNINDFDEWARMDLEYIDNWSLWLDLKILIKTVDVVFAGTGK